MKQFTIEIRGVNPLLMHNSRLSDEFDPIAKAIKKITAKKMKQTEDDRWEKRRLEFLGSLYFDDTVGPYVPGLNIEQCLLHAARMTRNGKDIERGLRITSDVNPLGYDGPRDLDSLWGGGNPAHVHNASVVITRNRIIRTRPIFRHWAVEAEGVYDPGILDFESLLSFGEKAGQYIGLGDWRPRFGTFEAIIKEV
ncbi:hypothetical protein [Mycobacteroides abscessus]|uniref:hypothetical protein n=1 Tax=Mycobacteroides abscessus TaxID=36809 RepID=UPI00232D02B2|nr:hypothetical protein [Mycobacteroides abscessus]MDB2192120.1 hypothetical protein [Mycobacteroides abscessus subsp. abscessus]WJJ56658.1 hypothetical protein PROPHIBWHA1_43 [Mycobacterium phage prophiBWHA-1]